MWNLLSPIPLPLGASTPFLRSEDLILNHQSGTNLERDEPLGASRIASFSLRSAGLGRWLLSAPRDYGLDAVPGSESNRG